GRFHEISREGLKTAIDISAYSLVALSRAALPLFDKAGGGSVMSLTYNAVDRVVPSYNSMAMAKAVLQAETRHLPAHLAPHNAGLGRARVELAIPRRARPCMDSKREQPRDPRPAVLGQAAGDEDAQHALAGRVRGPAARQSRASARH